MRRAVIASFAIAVGCATGPTAKTPPMTATLPATPSPRPLAEPEPAYKVIGRARLAAVGDILMHGAVKESAAAANRKDGDQSVNFGGYGALFEELAQDLSGADVAFANLETPVTTRPEKDPRSFVFHAPPELLPALSAAGVDIVSLANNHAYDQGRKGLSATLEEIAKAGLRVTGAGTSRTDAEKPAIVEVSGVRVGFLGWSQFFNDPLNEKPEAPWANPIDADRMVAAIKAARVEADFVVASCHWGVEYATAPRQSEIDLAHLLIDAGADVVLGHHPHVLQPIEIFRAEDGRTGLVIYSLGNFVSNQSRHYAHGVTPEKAAETRDGVILHFAAEKRDYGSGVVRTELVDVRYEPLWTDNDTLDRRGKAPVTIRVVPIDRALAKTRTQIDALVAQRPAAGFSKEDAARLIKLKTRLDLLLRRKAEIAKRVGEDFLLGP